MAQLSRRDFLVVVDGKNPAPVDKWFIVSPLFTVFHSYYHLVQDFFQPPHVSIQLKHITRYSDSHDIIIYIYIIYIYIWIYIIGSIR